MLTEIVVTNGETTDTYYWAGSGCDSWWVASTIFKCFLTLLASKLYGHNRHAWDLSPSMAVNSRKVCLPGVDHFKFIFTNLLGIRLRW